MLVLDPEDTDYLKHTQLVFVEMQNHKKEDVEKIRVYSKEFENPEDIAILSLKVLLEFSFQVNVLIAMLALNSLTQRLEKYV